MSTAPVLTVMARWPAPGRCKRRLSRDLNQRLCVSAASERAARIQRRLCSHTLAVCRELHSAGLIQLQLAVSGLGPRHAQRWGQRLGAELTVLQGEGSLGCRLRRQTLRTHRVQRGVAQLFIGTDLPGLNRHALIQALAVLQRNDVVLGPACDGGYWLIGLHPTLLRRPKLWPFSGIPWGEATVLARTLQHCTNAELRTELLHEQQDIDHLRDLQPWLGL